MAMALFGSLGVIGCNLASALLVGEIIGSAARGNMAGVSDGVYKYALATLAQGEHTIFATFA